MSNPTRGHKHDEVDMVWVPYSRYKLFSKLSPQQIKEKLQQSNSEYTADLSSGFIHLKEHERFRFGAYSRSFKLQAKLYLIAAPKGTHVNVVLKPATKSLLILFFIIIFLLAGIIFSKRIYLSVGSYRDTIIACVGVLLLGYLLPVAAFNNDFSKLKLFIDDVLEVEALN